MKSNSKKEMRDFNKKEIASCIFSEEVKNNVDNTLKSFYGVKNVKYKSLTCGIGIEVSGSNNFGIIRRALVKLSGVPNETISIMSENEENLSAFYAYLPNKNKYLYDDFYRK